jgi:hypothetical protein
MVAVALVVLEMVVTELQELLFPAKWLEQQAEAALMGILQPLALVALVVEHQEEAVAAVRQMVIILVPVEQVVMDMPALLVGKEHI